MASITEFTKGEDGPIEWRIVDDGVMGGLSKGRVSFTDEGTMRFEGTLSLENNGGFSSVRTGTIALDLGKASGLKLRVRGDGRTYQLRLSTDARYRGMEVSFRAEFPTVADEWTEVMIPFTAFTGGWRGRDLPDQTLDPAKIARLGLLLGDKKPGPFSLEVDWIRADGSPSGDPDAAASR